MSNRTGLSQLLENYDSDSDGDFFELPRRGGNAIDNRRPHIIVPLVLTPNPQPYQRFPRHAIPHDGSPAFPSNYSNSVNPAVSVNSNPSSATHISSVHTSTISSISTIYESPVSSINSVQSGGGSKGRVSISSNPGSSAFKNRLQGIEFRPENPCNDLIAFLEATEPLLRKEIKKSLKSLQAVKCWLVVKLTYTQVSKDEPSDPVYIRPPAFTVHNKGDIDLKTVFDDILNGNCNHIRYKSGLIIRDVLQLDLQMAEFHPMSGSSYQPLPKFLQYKNAIINVKNTDNRCFGYAILAAKYSSTNKTHDKILPRHYDKYFETENLHTLNYPVDPLTIRDIEEQLNLKINIFTFFDDEGKGRVPFYVSRREEFSQEINLLYWDHHYAWIHDISRLLFDITGNFYYF
jgi:hypothetical protein